MYMDMNAHHTKGVHEMKNVRKNLRKALCLLLLLCLTAATAGCASTNSEAPKAPMEGGEISQSESSAVSEVSEPMQTDDVPEGAAELSDTREALLRSLAGELFDGAGADACAVYGEVGAYTLCFFPFGGDAAVVEEVFAGYRISSDTVGYPSATHLYLVGDKAVYTLRAAYTRGLIEDMGDLYALLPKEMQAGYDPSAEDAFYDEADLFGFADGVYVVLQCGMAD